MAYLPSFGLIGHYAYASEQPYTMLFAVHVLWLNKSYDSRQLPSVRNRRDRCAFNNYHMGMTAENVAAKFGLDRTWVVKPSWVLGFWEGQRL